MAVLIKTLPKKVWDLIYDQQRDLKKAKNRCVSMEQTIAFLLENAYLTPKKDGKSKEA